MTVKQQPETPGGSPVVPETSTPPPAPPPAPVTTETLQAEIKALGEKVQSQAQHITDVSTENATLRQRYDELDSQAPQAPQPTPEQNKSQVDNIATLAETDPKEAMKQMHELHQGQLQQMQTQGQIAREQDRKFTEYVDKIYSDNPDLKPYNEYLGPACQQYIAQGMNPFKAADKVVKEFKATLEASKVQPSVPPAGGPQPQPGPTPVPAGAKGEVTPSVPPAKPAAQPEKETTSDVVDNREQTRLNKALRLT